MCAYIFNQSNKIAINKCKHFTLLTSMQKLDFMELFICISQLYSFDVDHVQNQYLCWFSMLFSTWKNKLLRGQVLLINEFPHETFICAIEQHFVINRSIWSFTQCENIFRFWESTYVEDTLPSFFFYRLHIYEETLKEKFCQ